MILAIIVSASYVVGFGLWLLVGNLGPIVANNHLNEVGDFVAGIFAPLALVWLVAAVLTQRQELNDTREQFRQNQLLTNKQMEFINRQNKHAEISARKAYRLTLFDKRFEIYEELRKFGEDYARGNYTIDSHAEIDGIKHRSAFVFNSEIESWIGNIAEAVYECTQMTVQLTSSMETGMDKSASWSIIGNQENWIWEQLQPLSLSEKLGDSMRVSDD